MIVDSLTLLTSTLLISECWIKIFIITSNCIFDTSLVIGFDRVYAVYFNILFSHRPSFTVCNEWRNLQSKLRRPPKHWNVPGKLKKQFIFSYISCLKNCLKGERIEYVKFEFWKFDFFSFRSFPGHAAGYTSSRTFWYPYAVLPLTFTCTTFFHCMDNRASNRLYLIQSKFFCLLFISFFISVSEVLFVWLVWLSYSCVCIFLNCCMFERSF